MAFLLKKDANAEEDSQDRIENGEGSEKSVDKNDADDTTASDHVLPPCCDDIEVKDWVMVDYDDVHGIPPRSCGKREW